MQNKLRFIFISEMRPILDEVKVTKSFRNMNVFPQKFYGGWFLIETKQFKSNNHSLKFYTRGERGRNPVVTGSETRVCRERDGMLLICPARGKLLRRAGQYLVTSVRIPCSGRQKTWLSGLLALSCRMQRQSFLDAKIQKKSQKCKFFLCFLLTYS